MFLDLALLSELNGSLAFIYSRVDPAIVFALGFATLGTQALLWGIARDSADIEWWRAASIAAVITVVSLMVLRLLAIEESLAFGPIVAAIVGCAFATWLVGGFVYDLETWQRAVLTVTSPVIGTLSLVIGVWLRNAVIGGLMAS
ncbi:MAG: hypothetical protein KDN20_03730 [Verrucomicrobiae bacterium]|nr:hypothetical protein [Verrucomicrobiae bacterium]